MHRRRRDRCLAKEQADQRRCQAQEGQDRHAAPAIRSPASALSISAIVSSTPYSAMNPPNRGPWLAPNSTS